MAKVLNTIGKTPLVQPQTIGGGRIFARVEKSNPAGSIRDRPAYQMIQGAIEEGLLKPGMEIVEPTLGNTGIVLAPIDKVLGYQVSLVMSRSISIECRKLMVAYGVKIILTGDRGMKVALEKAQEMVQDDRHYTPGQFDNPLNVQAHILHTGPETLDQVPDIRGFVAEIGTGGAVTGVGKVFKGQDPSTQVWGLEPTGSSPLTRGKSGSHKIRGIGANFVPSILDQDLLGKVVTVKGQEALDMAQRLAKEEGLFVGISSGASVAGALKLLEEVDGPAVTVLADTGERYLSTDLMEL